jgi:glycolate oxidase iron-sulfur subunit
MLDVGCSGAPKHPGSPLTSLDFSVLQQCIHCGLCLPTCPTYDATGLERSSPRGRIALMRAVAQGKLEPTRAFAEEMSFCVGCLACQTACPAGVDYATLLETARAESENSGVLDTPWRRRVRHFTMQRMFKNPRLLRRIARLLRFWQASGLQTAARWTRLTRLLPKQLRDVEPLAPKIRRKFSSQLIQPLEKPAAPKYRVAFLTGCVQDVVFGDINRDTVDVLLANGCSVTTLPEQGCCGSLHAHNGDLESARELARRHLDLWPFGELDAIITNAAGCGSHLKRYDHLLADDPVYAMRAQRWSAKVRDISEWLVEIGVAPPGHSIELTATYHDACHLCHGQKITAQPRAVLGAIPGLKLVELPESTWCCGSAGIYNITQPDMAAKLLERKIARIRETGVSLVATANPGCHLQLLQGLRAAGMQVEVVHPVSLLAWSYRGK